MDVDGPVGTPANSGTQFGEAAKVARLGGNFTYGSGGSSRVRPSARGANKRGRPRGSRRGGQSGGKGRGVMLLHSPGSPSSSSVTMSSPTSSAQYSYNVAGDGASQHGQSIFLFLIITFSSFPFCLSVSLPSLTALNLDFCPVHNLRPEKP